MKDGSETTANNHMRTIQWLDLVLDIIQIGLFCVLTSPCSKRCTSSVHMAFNNHCVSRSNSASTYVANFSLLPVSASNNWRSVCVLLGYKSKISCRVSLFPLICQLHEPSYYRWCLSCHFFHVPSFRSLHNFFVIRAQRWPATTWRILQTSH